jgi:hypothetical protein
MQVLRRRKKKGMLVQEAGLINMDSMPQMVGFKVKWVDGELTKGEKYGILE